MKPKRPYQAPKIVSSEVYERLALGCNGIRVPPNRTRPKQGTRCTSVASS